jgi:UDP-GlcNAc:undecaprenyl-phosphate GlcNAc-1-phosphate transferase
MMSRIVFPLLLSFLVSFVTAPILRKVALKWGIVDHPEVRKLQKEPVPLLGGAAVYLGIFLGVAPIFLFARSLDGPTLVLLLAASLIFVASLIDDKKKLSARLRLVVQLAAALIVIGAGIRIDFLPNDVWGNAGEVLITLLWILGITNSFNYLDGIDGLCCGIGIICSFFFFVVLLSTGQIDLIFLPLAIIGSCLGFLPSNFRKEKMFLGDAGSICLGFLISGIALMGNWASDNIIKISVPILILGVPIFDMIFTTIMRVRENKIRTIVQWLEYAGRDHFHHYLMDLGLRSLGAVFFICSISISMGISAIIIAKSDRAFYGILTIFKGAIMFGLVAVLMVLGRRLHKTAEVRERIGI